MIAQEQSCLDPNTLVALLSGKLPAERFAKAIEHVEACPRCRQIAEEQSSDDGQWLAGWAKEDASSPFEAESHCQAVLGNLMIAAQACIDCLPDTPLPRDQLGPYRLLKRLGMGGMGAVYLAEHQRLRKPVAVKILPREKLVETGWLERFNREMTSVAALEHPHIVRALDAGDQDDWHYLVMEYLDGLDLGRVCRRLPEIPVGAACHWIRQAALGLAEIHARGMIHRDIKPSNLFVTRTGDAKLLDLGLVLDGQSPLQTDERLTTVGHLMGTLPYMPREQLTDARRIDHRADIYSLGATLYRMLVGSSPFAAFSGLPQVIQAINTLDCPSIAELRTELPSELCSLIDSMLCPDLDQRPQSAELVAAAIQPWCDENMAKQAIRAALLCDSSADEIVSCVSEIDLPHRSAPTVRPKKMNLFWVAAASLVAFAAGIMLILASDRGTLTIESNVAGVTVKISQQDQLVEELVIDQRGGNKLSLRSGRYQVELEGVNAGQVEISDEQVAITRGDEQIVRITRTNPTPRTESGPATLESAKPQRIFQGKPLAHWMQVLSQDQDIDTLAMAMQSVVLLAESDEEKLTAARRLLLPARRFGGVVQSGRPNEGSFGTGFSKRDMSGWFMSELVQWFPNFYPHPGFEAVVDELQQGTEESRTACILLLFDFPSTPGIQAFYQSLSRDAAGQEKLTKLFDALTRSIETDESSTPAPSTIEAANRDVTLRLAMQQLIMVSNAMDRPLEESPVIVRWAERNLREASEKLNKPGQQTSSSGGTGGMGGMFGGMGGGYPIEISPLSASDALTIYEIHSNLKKDFDPVPIVLGLLQLSSVTDQPQILVALRELQESHPAQSANAIELLLDRAPSPMPNGFGGQITPNESLTSQAMRMLCEGHPEPITAALSLARMLWQKRMPHGFDERLILAEATPLFERIVRETDLEDAPDGQARLAYAARFLAMGRIVSNESLVILLSQLRDFTPEGKLNRLSDWPVEEDTKFDHASRSARWSLGSNYYLALQQIIANNPASSVEAMNIELEHGIASSAKYCSLLLPSLYDIHDDRAEIETPDETRAQRKQWRQWIATQQGRESLKRLAVQFSAALENVRQDAQTNSSQQATDTIDGLTATIVGIAQALKQDLSQYPAAATALRELVELESTRPIEESFNTRTERNLQAYAKLQGNDQVPLAAILRWAWSQQTATPLASQLIEEIRASRPAEFDAYFLAQLEAARIEHFQGLANLYRRNRSTIAIWHLVVGNLMQSPELREQTIAAINQLIELANGDEFITQPLRSLLRQ